MYKKLTLIVVFALAGLITMATPLLAQEIYLAQNNELGQSEYILCNLDGTFGPHQYIGQIPQPYYPYGNGIGDFDNDGDFDYIIGTGYFDLYAHEIYLYEKLGSGNNFAAPVLVGTWTEGAFAMSMAVADYNKDGNTDFVLTHWGSANCELYLGNGDLTFSTPSILYSTAPINSIGADAADFNNDCKADFVVSHLSNSNPDPGPDLKADTSTSHNPYYLYVNLGNGDGTFTTKSFQADGQSWGVTAGDFDNDGNDDIIVGGCRGDEFYFYKGNGDGTFQTGVVLPGIADPSVLPPLDNWDFNSDGNMDFVLGEIFALRYYMGNGDGTFTFVLETTGSNVDPYGLSAPPVEPCVGAIGGNVTHDNGDPVANVTVKVIDSDNNQVGDPIVTGSDGSFYFHHLLVGTYSVMIVTPLGYSVSPGETQIDIEVTAYPCTEVYFVLTPTITSNDCRTIGYWKHQFDVYTSNRGKAQETSADLLDYLDQVHVHFDILGVYIDLENFGFEDAKNILTVKGGRLMEDRAKQQLFGLLLNFASGKIGNETVVSEDGRVAAEAVTLVATLINDGDPANDELAKTICDLINNGQMVEAGIIPESPIRYRGIEHVGIPMEYTLNQNYPNPFNPATEISYTLPRDGHVKLEIYNLLGQKVATLVDEYQQTGQKNVNWEPKDLASGIYFYKLSAGKFTATKKMLLTK